MRLAAKVRDVRAVEARVTKDTIIVRLDDGRTITTPLAWYPRLVHGSPQERQHFLIIGGGQGVHWPDLDEDLSIAGMLAGRPSGEGPRSLQRWLDARHGRPAQRRRITSARRGSASRQS
jgi:hypothetical protein